MQQKKSWSSLIQRIAHRVVKVVDRPISLVANHLFQQQPIIPSSNSQSVLVAGTDRSSQANRLLLAIIHIGTGIAATPLLVSTRPGMPCVSVLAPTHTSRPLGGSGYGFGGVATFPKSPTPCLIKSPLSGALRGYDRAHWGAKATQTNPI